MRRLRSHLLVWLLVPLLLLWALAFRLQVQRSAAQSDEAHDRVLLGSALVIAERIAVRDGDLTVDVPTAALHMLEASEQDRVFYNVSCVAPAAFIAGDRTLPAEGMPEDDQPVYRTTRHAAVPVRMVVLRQSLRGARNCNAVFVRVAETTEARQALSGRILINATLMQLALIGCAAALIVFGVRRGLHPLRRIRDELLARGRNDLSPIDTRTVPTEVIPLIDAMNLQMARQRDLNDAQQRFFTDASHQLKTPLAVLRTQAELALQQSDPARMRSHVEELHEGTLTTARVVQQLLGLLRSDPTVFHETESIDLVEVAREASFDLLPLALAKSVDLEFDGNGPAPVRLQAVLLHELVTNLVDNAIRYTPDGGRIRVGARGSATGGAQLTVADSGPGIPPEQRDKVFARFYRMPGSGGDGCGLGLAIVRQIAERHGANVVLDTATEGGLRVRVRFPAGAAAAG